MARGPYDVLGVAPDASPEQIKAAYRHWAEALQSDTDAPPTRELRDLQEAYVVLGHPERRQAYERQKRKEAEPLGPPREGAEKLDAPTETPPIEFSLRESQAAAQPSFEELFDRLWSNFDRVVRPKAERLESLTIEIPLKAEEAQRGGRARILIPARAHCPACFGHGSVGLYQCWRCQGHGAITADYPVEVGYPPGVANEHVAQIPLDRFGIENFYLTVRFRVGAA